MKWVVLGGKDQEVRFRALSEFMNTSGYQNEVEFLSPEPNDFLMELERMVARVDQIRLQSPYSDRAQDFQNRATDLVNLVGSADAVIKTPTGSWWPENIMYEAVCLEFIRHVKHVDLSTHVLMVGSGSAARVVLAALIKLGFSKFYISDRFEDRAKKTIEAMKKRFFGIDFSFIPAGSLMLLPGSSSILVNGTPLVPENDLLKDLYYFNFLKPPATIIDLNLIPPVTPLMSEGERIGAASMGGFEIASRVDVLWAKRAMNLTLDLEAYKKFLEKKLSEIPFDPEPYKLA